MFNFFHAMPIGSSWCSTVTKLDTLLRIERFSFARRNAEEVGVEVRRVSDESPPAVGQAPGRCRLLAVPPIDVEAVRRNLLDGIDSIFQNSPEVLESIDRGEAATDSDDGNWRVTIPVHATATPSWSRAW